MDQIPQITLQQMVGGMPLGGAPYPGPVCDNGWAYYLEYYVDLGNWSAAADGSSTWNSVAASGDSWSAQSDESSVWSEQADENDNWSEESDSTQQC